MKSTIAAPLSNLLILGLDASEHKRSRHKLPEARNSESPASTRMEQTRVAVILLRPLLLLYTLLQRYTWEMPLAWCESHSSSNCAHYAIGRALKLRDGFSGQGADAYRMAFAEVRRMQVRCTAYSRRCTGSVGHLRAGWRCLSSNRLYARRLWNRNTF